jgi:hypothetical protein
MSMKVCPACSKETYSLLEAYGTCYACTKENPEVVGHIEELKRILEAPVVLPVGEYCAALRNWAQAIAEGVRDNGKDNAQGGDYTHLLHRIMIDIEKSALLNRLIYNGGVFRTQKCPTHKGRLNMAEWIGNPYEPLCEHRCDGTGWLRDPSDKANKHPWVCNRPHESEFAERGTEYCRQKEGHEGKCSAWFIPEKK